MSLEVEMSDWGSIISTAETDAATEGASTYAMHDTLRSRHVVAYIEEMARTSADEGDFAEALSYYGRLIAAEPENVDWRECRAHILLTLQRVDEGLRDAERIIELHPHDARGYRLQAEAYEASGQPERAIQALTRLVQLTGEDSPAQLRIDFLRMHLCRETPTIERSAVASAGSVELDDRALDQFKELLRRESEHRSAHTTLARLDDATWCEAWEQALRGTTGANVILCGSELGLHALLALRCRASHVWALERVPLERKIAFGILQRNLFAQWEAYRADRAADEDVRRRSFETFSKAIEVLGPDDPSIARANADYLVFPNIDHSLLGTGIVAAVRTYRNQGPARDARVLPAKAKVFAMGITWREPLRSDVLELSQLLARPHSVQRLDLDSERWEPLTAPTCVGTIDFERFEETTWAADLPVVCAGKLDAIVYWFELELGAERITNAPGSRLRCIRPAITAAASIELASQDMLALNVQVQEQSLRFAAGARPSSEEANRTASSIESSIMPGLRAARSESGRADASSLRLFDAGSIGESVVHVLTHAREHWPLDRARDTPARVVVHGIVIERRFDRLWGFDARLLNAYRASPLFAEVDASKLEFRPLSAPFELFSFDLATDGGRASQRLVEVPSIDHGIASGVLCWFDLQIGADCVISNAPGARDRESWKQLLQWIPERHVQPGLPLALRAAHDDKSMSLRWQQDQAIEKHVATHFDVRSFVGAVEAGHDTRRFLERWRQNEYHRLLLSQLVTEWSSEPAAHGLDPIVLERCLQVLAKPYAIV
jgi:tetratricopeptide (TPR) repeat protein